MLFLCFYVVLMFLCFHVRCHSSFLFLTSAILIPTRINNAHTAQKDNVIIVIVSILHLLKSDQIVTLNSKMPNVPQIGKLLRNDAISTSDTSIAIADLSKYNVFQAYLASSFQGGPCIGMRISATAIIFFGASLASGGSLTYTLAQMKTNGDSFAGWDTAGTYGTKWGGNVNGISKIYGIA